LAETKLDSYNSTANLDYKRDAINKLKEYYVSLDKTSEADLSSVIDAFDTIINLYDEAKTGVDNIKENTSA
jgi:glutamate mutase epsilon subunit